MAKKSFDLGDYLRAAEGVGPYGDGAVPTVDKPEQIEYIPLEKIDPDPENFYSLEGIDELAGNIELVGLQQPLRVRGGEGGRVTVVSGHRRRAACLLIRDGGNPMFDRGVPCIRERGDVSKEMRELRLIYANSSTRVMSAAELSLQAERVTELLYRLKEQGVEFPGRMRDHVAAAVQASKSRIGRLHAIRERLVPELLERFDRGEIGETVAYRLSQEDAGIQGELSRRYGDAVRGTTAATIELAINQLHGDAAVKAAGADIICPQARDEDEGGGEDEGPDAISGLKKYLDGKSKEDRKFWKLMQEAADSLIKRSFSSGAGQNRKENIDMLRLDCRNSGVAGFAGDYDGSNTGLTLDSLSRNPIKRTWTEVYDALAAIAITRYRQTLVDRGRGGPPRALAPTEKATVDAVGADSIRLQWQTGTPAREGRYLCRLDLGLNKLTEQRCDFRDGAWTAYGRPVTDVGEVVDWWPLPEEGWTSWLN